MNIEHTQGALTAPKGFSANGISAGLKRSGKKDLGVLFSGHPCRAWGAFTRNKVKAAPVYQAMTCLSDHSCQAVVVNSGSANACTGAQGLTDAEEMASLTAESLGIASDSVAVASTGVIGKKLDMPRIAKGIGECASGLSPEKGHDFAEAICTTDTKTKEVCARFSINGTEITVGGCAKGSGMIHPNLATMLAFITTDASISVEMGEKAFSKCIRRSFNSITVDGDTSTNDAVIMLANAQAGNTEIVSDGPEFDLFAQALAAVMQELATMIVRDGEGATKLVTIEVTGAPSEEEAHRAAMSVARSNLVKTALFGNDPNWGRILCATGYSGSSFDIGSLDLAICSVPVVERSEPLAFDEEDIRRRLDAKDVHIAINLNSGAFSATVWTCDLTYDYVKINAEYHT